MGYMAHSRRPRPTRPHLAARSPRAGPRERAGCDRGEPATGVTLTLAEEWLSERGFLEELLDDEMLENFDDGSLQAATQAAFDEVVADAEACLGIARSPLEAELWGSAFLGALGVPGMATAAVEELAAATFVPFAERTGNTTCLAMLVVLSSLADNRLGAAADRARRRLVARGLAEPTWAQSLGKPRLGRFWSQTDGSGAQDSLYLTFSYGNRQHLLSVLIDHELGGGVKDAWVSTGARDVGGKLDAAAAAQPCVITAEISPGEAARRLAAALCRPECCEHAEELETLLDTRALMRSRLRHLQARSEQEL
jgi:hypothetical protein